MFLLLSFLFFFDVHSDNHTVLTVQPIDIRDHAESEDPFFLQSLNQIETDGSNIFIRGMDEFQIVVIDPSGHVLNRIGSHGQGPGEFDNDVTAISIDRASKQLWILSNLRNKLSLYSLDGAFIKSFKSAIRSNGCSWHPTSNVFASNKGITITPWCSQIENEALGLVADHRDNKAYHVGKLPKQVDMAALQVQRAFYDTFWIYSKPNWYCVFMFQPVYKVFNDQFELLKTIEVQDNAIQYQFSESMQGLHSDKTNSLLPIFTDVKTFKGYIWLMVAPRRLLQVNPGTGEVKHVYEFIGKGNDFPKNADGSNKCCLTMPLFAILDNKTIILGHQSLLWDHDLWAAKLPGL